jgi:transposase
MYKDPSAFKKIYIACGYTDLRYGIDGLASTVQEVYHLDPFDEGTLFLFCGRKKDRIKGLLWEGDGFLLLYKRISDGRFMWPSSVQDLREMTADQYRRLMDGFSIESSIHSANPSYAG